MASYVSSVIKIFCSDGLKMSIGPSSLRVNFFFYCHTIVTWCIVAFLPKKPPLYCDLLGFDAILLRSNPHRWLLLNVAAAIHQSLLNTGLWNTKSVTSDLHTFICSDGWGKAQRQRQRQRSSNMSRQSKHNCSYSYFHRKALLYPEGK